MDNILEKIKEARAESKKRKFPQTWDLFINLKNINLKRPENRINASLVLPNGTGKDMKVAVFADAMAQEAKEHADTVIKKEEIEGLADNKKRLKKLVDEHDWFFGEVSVMALVGKALGAVMGPRGKVPKPIPPRTKIAPVIKDAKSSVRISVRDNPVIHVLVGREGMTDDAVAANAEAVINFVRDRLPKGLESIKSAHIKLTMGRPVKINVR